MGYLRDAIINFIALLGWSPRSEREFFTLKELEECFDVEGLNKSPSIFDMDKLTWFNAEYMRKLSPEAFYEVAKPWMAKVLDPERFDLKRLAELLQARTEVLNRIPGMIGFLAEMPEFDNDLYTHKKMKTHSRDRQAGAYSGQAGPGGRQGLDGAGPARRGDGLHPRNGPQKRPGAVAAAHRHFRAGLHAGRGV